MTKSSRRKDQLEGKPMWITSNEKCEECKGELVKTGLSSYVCTECGLMQTRFKVKKNARKRRKNLKN
ncbi:MAG: hypothetical protein ACFFD2_19035 [Promethearchaeota archaeon]